MFCAVSSAPILYEDRIVVLGLDVEPAYPHDRENVVGVWPRCGFRIAGLPIRGTYNDYGGILPDADQDARIGLLIQHSHYHGRYVGNDDEPVIMRDDHPEKINTNNYPLMFIHEPVYDYVCTRPLDAVSDRERREEHIRLWEMTKDSVHPDRDFFLREFFTRAFFGSGEVFGYPHHSWSRCYPDDVSGRNYLDEVRPIMEYSMTFGYRIAPSLYAGQTTMISDRDGLERIINTVRARHVERFEEWGD